MEYWNDGIFPRENQVKERDFLIELEKCALCEHKYKVNRETGVCKTTTPVGYSLQSEEIIDSKNGYQFVECFFRILRAVSLFP